MWTFSRRAAFGASLAGAVSGRPFLALAGQQATPGASPVTDPAGAIMAIAENAMEELSLRSVLLHVTIDGEEVVHHALGESMTGVPATPDMHIRNGAVAITYMSILMLRLVDEGTIALDDTIDAWMPDLPDADKVTFRMLAQMTSSYPDYVQNPAFITAFYDDPFRSWSTDEQIALGFDLPRVFAPGENWYYAHTNYVILGLVLEAVTGEPLDALLRVHIIDPLGLDNTRSEQTAYMPEPMLHAYSAERAEVLNIPEDVPFSEESTFWDPSWTVARGAVQYSTVADMASSFAAIGSGQLLSEASMQELLTRNLEGFGAPMEGCPSCHTFDPARLYGLGIWLTGGWMFQNPLFAGFGGIAAYHPDARIAIGIASTYADGGYAAGFRNASTIICERISAALAPGDPMLLS